MRSARETLAAFLVAFAVAWHVLAGLAPAWTTVGANPSRGRDFATYYYAVQVAADGGNPYDRGALGQAARREGTRRAVHPFLYPPPFLLLMAWAIPMELLPAYRAWFWLDELWLAVAALALWRWWRPLGTEVGALIAVAVAAFTAVPSNHVMGQANFPGLALAILGLWAADRDRWVVGGALMGAACMVKMSPALFLGLWLLRGWWRPVVVACATAVALTLAAIPILDLSRQLVFYTRVLPTFGSGEYNGLTVPIGMFGNHSLPNLWHQVFWQPGPTLSRAAQLASTATALLLVGGLMYRFRGPADALSRAARVGAIGVAMLLVPVYTYEHHCVWAIPAVVVALLALLRGRLSLRWAPVVGAAVAFWSFDILELKGAWLQVQSIPPLAWVLQELKSFALLAFLAATAQVGGDGYGSEPRGADDVRPSG